MWGMQSKSCPCCILNVQFHAPVHCGFLKDGRYCRMHVFNKSFRKLENQFCCIHAWVPLQPQSRCHAFFSKDLLNPWPVIIISWPKWLGLLNMLSNMIIYYIVYKSKAKTESMHCCYLSFPERWRWEWKRARIRKKEKREKIREQRGEVMTL